MANPTGKGGKKFGEGQVNPNTNGRPPLPRWLKESRKLREKDFEEFMDKFEDYSKQELQELVDSGELKIKYEILATFCIRSLVDHQTTKEYMNRRYGPVVEKIKHEGLTPFIIRKRDGEEIVMGTKIIDKDADK